jgi:peptide deformylase
MILKLVSRDDEILKQETKRWDFDNPPFDLEEFVENLCDTMVDRRGVGLSAVQVGVPYSVFVIGDYTKPEDIVCVVNPNIVNQSDSITLAEEGCLTFPGLFGKIKRYNEVRVRFANPLGNVQTVNLSGFYARVFQHEYDHCNGVVFTKRMSKYHLEQAKRQKVKLDKLRKRNSI